MDISAGHTTENFRFKGAFGHLDACRRCSAHHFLVVLWWNCLGKELCHGEEHNGRNTQSHKVYRDWHFLTRLGISWHVHSVLVCLSVLLDTCTIVVLCLSQTQVRRQGAVTTVHASNSEYGLPVGRRHQWDPPSSTTKSSHPVQMISDDIKINQIDTDH